MLTREEFEESFDTSMPPYHWYTIGYEQGEYDVDEWVSKCEELARENAALKVKLDLALTRLERYKRQSHQETPET